MRKLLLSQLWIFRFLRHSLLFVIMVGLFTYLVISDDDAKLAPMAALGMVTANAIFFFAYAYLTVYLLIPVLLSRQRWLFFVVLFILAGLLISWLKLQFSSYIFFHALAPESLEAPEKISFGKLLVNTKDMTFIVALFAIFKFARDFFMLEENNRELEKREMEAELRLIEQQMDPHVIFNNFNSLYAISIHKPELLGVTVKMLKENLHYLFSESKRGKTLLSRELEVIDNYIGLEKLRFGERLKISFKVEGNTKGFKIAPLILFGLVECAFVKGAGENPQDSNIDVKLKVENSLLKFTLVHSTAYKLLPEASWKEWYENSLKRLELQYPNRHRIRFRELENSQRIKLQISL